MGKKSIEDRFEEEMEGLCVISELLN